MRLLRTGTIALCPLLASGPAHAQTVEPALAQQAPVQQVKVSAAAADLRRQSTTTAIVVKRDELLRQGDATLAEVLKRQPGITVDATPGRQSGIRMRGLAGGYVAILLDGVPAPAGFALESISPDLVERVEIQRVATAETTGQAVAGAINIVLRKPGAGNAARDEIKAGSAVSAGYAMPSLVAQHGGRAGTLTYTLGATVKREHNPVSGVDSEQGPGLLRRTAWSDHRIGDMLELAPRLGWRPGAADSVTAQAYVRLRRNGSLHTERETLEAGAPAAFRETAARWRERPLKAFADLVWTRQLEDGASLETKLSGYHSRRGADFFFTGSDADGMPLETRHVASGPVERDLGFKGTWRRPVGAGHALAAGWEAGHKTRSEFRAERRVDYRNAATGVPLPASDERYRASVRRSAFYIQDEWELDKAWSAYLGLRREDLRTRGTGNASAPVDVGSGVWSPTAQVLVKLPPAVQPNAEGRHDQFRFAVSRSYKAPDIAQLMPRRYTVDNNNSANNPDQQGNPGLRPELALNVDLAWERYVGKDGMLGVSAFDKRIRDVTLDRVFETDGVWTATPVNAGRARVRGVEFEAKGTRGALAGRINLSRNWSRLERVPGPDNRIDGQPAWSGNLGLDWTAGARLEMGGSASYRGHYASRQSAVLAGSGAPRRLLDLYAVWKVDRNARLRLSANDLLHQDNVLGSVYGGDGWRARSVAIRTHTTWRVVWEQSLQ